MSFLFSPGFFPQWEYGNFVFSLSLSLFSLNTPLPLVVFPNHSLAITLWTKTILGIPLTAGHHIWGACPGCPLLYELPHLSTVTAVYITRLHSSLANSWLGHRWTSDPCAVPIRPAYLRTWTKSCRNWMSARAKKILLYQEFGWPYGCNCVDEESKRTRFHREKKQNDRHSQTWKTWGHVTKERINKPRMYESTNLF